MKKNSVALLICTVIIVLSGCKTKKTTGDENAANNSRKGDAVCIWDNISLKESPGKDGKWLATVSLGEKCIYLDNSREETNGEKKTKYLKIRLQDGKEGWAQSDFIVLDGKPGVIIQDAVVYSRPDLLTKTDKSFSRMDIIGVKEAQNDFIEVAGKRKAGKWIEKGWVKEPNISYSEVDIAVAKYAAKALAIADKEKREAAVKEIVDNKDLQESVFIADLKDLLVPTEDFIEAEVKSQASDTTNITAK
jgi:hypothetical protein